MTLKRFVGPCLIFFVFFLSAEVSVAEEAKTSVVDTSKALDPSRPKTKFFSRYEFKEDEAGNETSVIDSLYDFPINSDWPVRLQAPVKYRNPVLWRRVGNGYG